MSTSDPLVDSRAERPAEPTLFRALFDDAAVFPPGLEPLPKALADYLARQSSPYADLVGPLLLPADAVPQLLHLEPSRAVAVMVIGRPGTELPLVQEALARLQQNTTPSVAGVEIGWSPQWRQALAWNVSLSIEVPRGAEHERALADLYEHAVGDIPVQAKFRTGSTPNSSIPTPTELATFIRACVDHDLSFKLTGGLHHAVTSTVSDHTSQGVEDQFGFLNVIAATRWALAHAAEVPELESLLSQRDPLPILDIITRMSEADASVVRAFFTAYGCCGVMDPIGDLVALGLIKEQAV